MTETDKIQAKKIQMRIDKLAKALKQNISRRKNINQKNTTIKNIDNTAS